MGGGLSGCTAARVLAEEGHRVIIVEKTNTLGGLAMSRCREGYIYEPYGNHAFHTSYNDVWEFVNRFTDFSDYKHQKGILLFGNQCFRYPLFWEDIVKNFPPNISSRVQEEYMSRSRKKVNPINYRSFKKCVEDMIGPTLYKLIIHNYTLHQWGINPEYLSPDWAPKRIEVRVEKNKVEDKYLFRDKFQGMPKRGYTEMCFNMVNHGNIVVEFCRKLSFRDKTFNCDLILCSAPIDTFLYKKTMLPYRGAKFIFNFHGIGIPWENSEMGTINFSQGPILRKMNFGVIHKSDPKKAPRAIQLPSSRGKFYAVQTKKSTADHRIIVREALRKGIVPFGRLGAFKYLNMDEAIKTSMELAKNIELFVASYILDDKVKFWNQIFGEK